jgi:YVTN family beta-propeller protein
VVTNYGNREAPGSSLTVLDVPEATVVRTIDLGEYRRPHGIAWLPDGKRVVVTAEENQAVIVVGVTSGKILNSIDTGQSISHMLAVTPDGKRAFVANIGSGTMTALDLDSGVHLADVATGEGAEGIDITPDGRNVWVTNRAADTVSIIDASSLEVVETLKCAAFPIRAKATPDGRHVLVSNARSGNLAVFDTKNRKEKRRVPLELTAAQMEGRLFGDRFGDSSVPIGILIPPDGKRAYVAHANADAISVVDLKKWEAVGTLTAGKEPDGMAYSPLQVRPSGD